MKTSFHLLGIGQEFWFRGYRYVRTGPNAARPVGEVKELWFAAHEKVIRA